MGQTTPDDNAPVEGLFQLGGLFRLSGLQEDQLPGQHAGIVELIYLRRLSNVRFFRTFAGISLETGNVWQRTGDISWDNTILAGSLFVGFDTPIGPLYVGYGRTDTDRGGAYVYLGPRFTF